VIPRSSATWTRLAGGLGVLAVAAGAFGAHALAAHPRLDTWKTAALYHLVHAVALALPALPVATRTWFFAGILLFSGSLYALVLLDAPRLGMITPLGGLCFLAGWAWLAVRGPMQERPA
jgi:uncharacterized membrane protein YgdD (TMEM256/DUF423 family)